MRFRLLENIAEVDNEGNPLTVEQVEFFKGSKVRQRGKLAVCYHSSDSDFTTFDKLKIGSGNGGANFGKGFYFSYTQNLSKGYGRYMRAFYLNIINPFDYGGASGEEIKELLTNSNYKYDEDFVNSYDFDRLWDADLIDDFFSEALIGVSPYAVFSQMVRNAGYDGISVGDEVVAFEPNQIKSITNKNPSSSSNINESKETQFLSDEQIKQFLSEIGNICWYSKSMCMDEACVYLESEFSINALWKANSIYIGDKRLLSIEFSHEGKNCWAVYQVHFYDNKKTYGVGDW